MKTKLTELLNIQYPIIQAPMFLVSNVAMVTEAMDAGIAGCIPALNYRTLEELKNAKNAKNAKKKNTKKKKANNKSKQNGNEKEDEKKDKTKMGCCS